MIHWLTQTHTELPTPARAMEMGGYLTEEEETKLLTLRTNKRREDWLLGRWTAKRLLQTVIWEKNGTSLPLDLITITNNADGVPDYRLPDEDHKFSISISHSHGRAFVAAIEKANAPIGADLEKIEQRPSGFVESYFTRAEQTAVLACAPNQYLQNVLMTAIWSAKESVLKALHLGLSVDTLAVECLLDPIKTVPTEWVPFVVGCDNGRLPKVAPPLMGWWRVEDGFVLTVVTRAI